VKPLFQVAAFVIAVGVTTQHADAQCCGQSVATYSAPVMTHYAPTTYYAPATGCGSTTSYYGGGYYSGGNYGGGAFGTGVGGWRGVRGMSRRIDRRN
jgi:hypothetical protein